MGAHPNVHVPKESWPSWTWYAIEFGIVLAISMLVSREITNSIEGLTPEIQNWVFMGIVGAIFLVWYIIIRSLILKKKILENKY
jgi:bacteriorhodopsin